MSTSFVDRGSPCTELANEPPITYEMPSRVRTPATRTATEIGSGSDSGAIPRAVYAIDQIVSQPHSGES